MVKIIQRPRLSNSNRLVSSSVGLVEHDSVSGGVVSAVSVVPGAAQLFVQGLRKQLDERAVVCAASAGVCSYFS